jgi:hypothetical protein
MKKSREGFWLVVTSMEKLEKGILLMLFGSMHTKFQIVISH